MKKMIKLSLVAAVAVAGLTSTATAGDLSEMIKGVQTSGFMRYRNTDKAYDAAGDANLHEYKIVVNNKIKVNDDVTANVKLVGVNTTANAGTTIGDGFKITRANFTYTGIKGLTATYGIQGYNLPQTNDEEGQGLRLTGNIAGVTLIGASYNADLDDSSASTNAIAAVVPAGPVTLTGSLVKFGTDLNDKSTYINAKAKIANVNVSATVTDKDLDADNNDYGLKFITASTNLAGFGITLGYAKSDDNGGNTHVAGGGAGDRTASQFALIQASAGDFADADTTLISVSKKVGPVALTLAMADADTAAANMGATETVLKAAYAMSKNFKVSGWVSQIDAEAANSDNTWTRLEIKYSF